MEKVSACLSLLSLSHPDINTHTLANTQTQSHLALRAVERLLARVDPFVELQLVLVLEPFGAELANARRTLLIRKVLVWYIDKQRVDQHYHCFLVLKPFGAEHTRTAHSPGTKKGYFGTQTSSA